MKCSTISESLRITISVYRVRRTSNRIEAIPRRDKQSTYAADPSKMSSVREHIHINRPASFHIEKKSYLKSIRKYCTQCKVGLYGHTALSDLSSATVGLFDPILLNKHLAPQQQRAYACSNHQRMFFINLCRGANCALFIITFSYFFGNNYKKFQVNLVCVVIITIITIRG
jgi:hypothetical protein